MKKTVFYLFLFILSSIAMNAQEKIDINQRPSPLEAKEFAFPKHIEQKLENGIKVFVIEDKEQPIVAFSVLIPGGSSVEGDKAGVSDFVAALLSKGAGKRDALAIANALDGVGASISANATADNISIYATALKKHQDLLLELLSDMIINPTFPKDEFEKLKPMFLASIKLDKTKPSTVANNMAKKILYGDDHPYSSMKTEESIKNLTIDDLKEYYNKWFKPNAATIAAIGDVQAIDIIQTLNSSLKVWKEGKTPEIKIPKAEPQPLGVYFVHRPGSVQSLVSFTSIGIPLNHNDYEVLEVAGNIIGSGFAGRLFRTLRETYSYTYSPWGYLTNAKYINRFICGAEVRNSVTDSSVDLMKEQLRLLASVPPTDAELGRIIKFKVGQYYLNFENSNFIANLIQGADFNGKNIELLKDYPKRLQAFSSFDVMNAANKYMNPKNAYLIVVGSPEVLPLVEKYGKVYEYDLDLNPLSGEKAKMEKVSLSAKDLIKKYRNAIGGDKAIESTKSIISEAKVEFEIQGQIFPGTLIQKTKAPNKQFISLDIGVMKQKTWVDGTNAWGEVSGAVSQLEGKELKKALKSATVLSEAKLLDLGYTCEVLGKQGNSILMKAKSEDGLESTYYFNDKTFLIEKIEKLEDGPQGPMPVTETYSDYTKFDKILLPKIIKNESPYFNMSLENSYKLNEDIEDSEFTPDK